MKLIKKSSRYSERNGTYGKNLLRVVALFVAIGSAITVSADSKEVSSLTIRTDNDLLGGTDERYTAGIEFDFAYEPWSKPDDLSVYHNTLAFGQMIFSPESVKETELVVNDRPYAGWTYLRYGRHRSRANFTNSWQLTLGMVGPSSYGEDVQRAVHGLIGETVPLGWDNQLSDEFGYALEHSRQSVLFRRNLGGERSVQVAEIIRFSLGNIDTSLSEGFQIRLGKNMIGAPTQDRMGSPVGFVDERAPFADAPKSLKPQRFYWLEGAKSTYVARNLFLDGITNNQSHQVDKHPFVHQVEAGFAYSKSGFKFSLVMVYRSEEFREQVGGQTFGALSFNFKR